MGLVQLELVQEHILDNFLVEQLVLVHLVVGLVGLVDEQHNLVELVEFQLERFGLEVVLVVVDKFQELALVELVVVDNFVEEPMFVGEFVEGFQVVVQVVVDSYLLEEALVELVEELQVVVGNLVVVVALALVELVRVVHNHVALQELVVVQLVQVQLLDDNFLVP